MLLILPIFCQWITNDLQMHFLCYYHFQLFINCLSRCLSITSSFLLHVSYCCCSNYLFLYTVPIFLPIITILIQCLHNQLTNDKYIITNHIIGNFLPIGNQCFSVNHNIKINHNSIFSKIIKFLVKIHSWNS